MSDHDKDAGQPKKQDELLNHNYDGIQEYDNDLPRWWIQLFWLTTIVGVVYAIWFHLPSTPTPVAALNAKLQSIATRAESSQNGASPGQPAVAELTEEALLRIAADTAMVNKGKEIFAVRCVACHAAEGQGLIGPNLTDAYWIHGGTLMAIRSVISEGVPEKGMLSWKMMLSGDDMNALAAYIWSIRGTKPANPKAAEGTLVQ